MNTTRPASVSLVSQWFIRPDCVQQVLDALPHYVHQVETQEPGTLMYLVHRPRADDSAETALQSLPPAVAPSLWFVEEYADEAAFLSHLHGPAFTGFVAACGHCFVDANGAPYTTVVFLQRLQGFIRSGTSCQAFPEPAPQIGSSNRHPAVMFEIIACDQKRAKAFYSEVFGWQYQNGSAGFAYVHFPLQLHALLGGIGQAQPGVPGLETGHSFYLLVQDLQQALDRALAAGGRLHMPITAVDGYHFAMIKDPEGNPVGLLQAS